MQQCTGCKKSKRHCFWYQKPSNLLQVVITHNAFFVGSLSTGTKNLPIYCRCKKHHLIYFFEHGNYKTCCKQCVFNKCNGLNTKESHAAMYRMGKSPKNCFWYQKPSDLLKNQITFQNKNHKTSC